eukprot:scaffold77397_cov61-Phaeocystis_antarctica.AAC.6
MEQCRGLHPAAGPGGAGGGMPGGGLLDGELRTDPRCTGLERGCRPKGTWLPAAHWQPTPLQ